MPHVPAWVIDTASAACLVVLLWPAIVRLTSPLAGLLIWWLELDGPGGPDPPE